jgi:hypothetical protein
MPSNGLSGTESAILVIFERLASRQLGTTEYPIRIFTRSHHTIR